MVIFGATSALLTEPGSLGRGIELHAVEVEHSHANIALDERPNVLVALGALVREEARARPLRRRVASTDGTSRLHLYLPGPLHRSVFGGSLEMRVVVCL